MMSRRLSSWPLAAPAPALDNDDILSEILLRLPPRPSSLPRASLVCKRWRRLVADPRFLRRFRGHHRSPPLLGFFYTKREGRSTRAVEFISALDSPDSIPAARFSLSLDAVAPCLLKILDCRHGRVLILLEPLKLRHYLLVWDPVIREQREVDLPRAFYRYSEVVQGALVCAAGGEQGHVHGSCHSSPFQLIVLGKGHQEVFACIYSSGTGTWGNPVSLPWSDNVFNSNILCSTSLVGNSICWLRLGTSFTIIKFDLRRQSLSAIELPSNAVDNAAFMDRKCRFSITPEDGGGGGLDLLCLSGFSAQVWKWKASSDGGAGNGWMQGSKVDLCNLLSLKAGVDTKYPEILGMAEEDNTIILTTDAGAFELHLESMQFKKLSIRASDIPGIDYPIRTSDSCGIRYPFRSFYCSGHITDGQHPLSTLSATGSTKRTITSMLRSQLAAKAIARNSENQSLKRPCPSMVKGHISLFGTHSAELDTQHNRSSNERDDCEKLIPHMFGSKVPTSIEGVQGVHPERSRSKRHAEYGNTSSSTMPPIQGTKKTKKQHKPTQEFSIANCVHEIREMIDLNDEEKVMSCDLFRDAANREIFLSLDGTLRTMWLKKQLTTVRSK